MMYIMIGSVERTDEEKLIFAQYENRRQRKNDRSRERAMEKKEGTKSVRFWYSQWSTPVPITHLIISLSTLSSPQPQKSIASWPSPRRSEPRLKSSFWTMLSAPKRERMRVTVIAVNVSSRWGFLLSWVSRAPWREALTSDPVIHTRIHHPTVARTWEKSP